MRCPFFDVHAHDDELNDDAHHTVEGWVRIQLMRAIWQNEPKCTGLQRVMPNGVLFLDRDGVINVEPRLRPPVGPIRVRSWNS